MKSSNVPYSRRTFLKTGSLAIPYVLLAPVTSLALIREQRVHRTAFAMGATVGIQAYHSDRHLLNNAISKAFNELYRLDALLSLYQPKSDISRINFEAGNNEIAVADETLDILEKAVHYSVLSNGVFDCTIEPLMKLWGFRERYPHRLPSDSEISSAVKAVGYRNISIDRQRKTVGLFNRQSSIDLGGIGGGYTVDRMAEILRKEGITSALINHSGDLTAIGSPPDEAGWPVGIPSPSNPDNIVHTITLTNRSLSTSGTSEKFITIDAQHYGHIIDRFTGKPVDGGHSISIITATPISADVYSTALFSSGVSAQFIHEPVDVIGIDLFDTVSFRSIG